MDNGNLLNCFMYNNGVMQNITKAMSSVTMVKSINSLVINLSFVFNRVAEFTQFYPSTGIPIILELINSDKTVPKTTINFTIISVRQAPAISNVDKVQSQEVYDCIDTLSYYMMYTYYPIKWNGTASALITTMVSHVAAKYDNKVKVVSGIDNNIIELNTLNQSILSEIDYVCDNYLFDFVAFREDNTIQIKNNNEFNKLRVKTIVDEGKITDLSWTVQIQDNVIDTYDSGLYGYVVKEWNKELKIMEDVFRGNGREVLLGKKLEYPIFKKPISNYKQRSLSLTFTTNTLNLHIGDIIKFIPKSSKMFNREYVVTDITINTTVNNLYQFTYVLNTL